MQALLTEPHWLTFSARIDYQIDLLTFSLNAITSTGMQQIFGGFAVIMHSCETSEIMGFVCFTCSQLCLSLADSRAFR